MEQFLAQFADVGGPVVLVALALKYWTEFQNLLGQVGDVADWTASEVRKFASRTSVIVTRKIWWIILPVMYVETIASTISAWQIEGYSWWFAGNLLLKLLALVVASVMAGVSSRVKHIPDSNTLEQAATNAAYGRPWLFVPMIATAMFSLVALTGATLSDTFMLADRVHYFHSAFSAVLFAGMLVFTRSLVRAGFVSVYALSKVGIDVGGAGWNGVAAQAITKLVVGLTNQNNRLIMITDAARKSAGETARALFLDYGFLDGVIAAWILWFMCFHSPIGWLVELVIIISLVCALLIVWLITQRQLTKWRDGITFLVAALGVVCIFWRLIDAAVPPQPGEAHHAVMFYYRFGRLLAWIGSGFTWLVLHKAALASAFAVVSLVVAGGAVWLAKKANGTPARLLFVAVAVICLFMGIAMPVFVGASAGSDSATVEQPSETVASSDVGFSRTGNAGEHSCSTTDPSRPCPP
jgi:hypothetical protein